MAFVDWCFIRFQASGACDECGLNCRKSGATLTRCEISVAQRHREAHEWCCGSINGEAGKSLKVNLAGKNVWSDFRLRRQRRPVDLWVLVRNCSLHEAMREAKEMLGLKDNDQHFQAKKKASKTQEAGREKG